MNIANPCKLLLVAGALFAGVAIRADGTLPLPVASSELPMLMNGLGLEKTTSVLGGTTSSSLPISMTLDEADATSVINPKFKARCRATESFYPAAGTVQVAEDLFDIQGICAPGATTPGPRQVIATSTGRILQFDGSFVVNAAKTKSFKGQLLTIDSVATTPESGAGVTKTITFELTQSISGQ